MLGNHEGITPLEDPSQLTKPALVMMGRLSAGKSVDQRRLMLKRVVEQIAPEDRYWPEAIASRLTDQGIDAGVANIVAFAVAVELRDEEAARLMRSTNGMVRDPFAQSVIEGLMAADADFGRRIFEAKIDSDEIFVRVALAHFFRRDPKSAFQIMMIHMAAKKFSRAFKGGSGWVAEWALDRIDDEPAPEGMWGYLVVLRDAVGRSGFYLPEPTEVAREQLDEMLYAFRAQRPQATEDQHLHACATAAFHSFYLKGDAHSFVGMMAVILDRMEQPYAVFYTRKEDDGYHTSIHEIPAQSVEQARRVVRDLPEVQMHDGIRKMTEYFAQLGEEGSDAFAP